MTTAPEAGPWLLDTALRRREAAGRPLRIGVVGAGTMGRAVVRQILLYTPGITVPVICNRTPSRALDVFRSCGRVDARVVSTVSGVEDAARAGGAVVVDDPGLVCRADGIDAVFEITGAIEPAAALMPEAIEHGKHVLHQDAELEATVGPAIKARADRAGVVFSNTNGDQPGLQVDLYRRVVMMGFEPLLCGNVKGLHDPYRNPETQAAFAREWEQGVGLVTSAADGTKISCEQAVVANHVGFTVPRRGMFGGEHRVALEEVAAAYDPDALRELGGIVDYIVGARPAGGVYCLFASDDPEQRRRLALYKLGPGPLYCLYNHAHLCHLEAPQSIARALLCGDATTAPWAGMHVEVVAVAKKDLGAGEILDGLGGFTMYGQCERAAVVRDQGFLPIGIAGGLRLKHAVRRDAVIRRDDVLGAGDRLVDLLRREQEALVAGT